jgi:GNAT superfamily N-acetyltransferase
MPEEWTRGECVVSTDPARLDVGVIYGFLRRAYWAKDIPRQVVERAIANSLNFGLYEGGRQIGFARVVTDRATFAYVADVFVLEDHRGQKLSVWLMECVAAHPELQDLRRWMLGTRDAHSLYEKTGFTRIAPDDGRWMEKADPDVYERMAKGAST